jgi:hypothetical protein
VIRTAVGVLALDAALAAIGYGLICAWLRGASLARTASFAGVAFLAGAGASAAGLEMLAVAGARTNLAAFAVLGAFLVATGVAIRAAYTPAPVEEPAASPGSRVSEAATLVLGTALVAIAALILLGGVRSTPWLDDSWSFWLPKGLILEARGLDPKVWPGLNHPDYPLGWSALLALGSRLGGHIDIRELNGVLASFTVGFLAATARLLWGLVRPPFVAGGLLLLALSPEFLRQTLGGGADLPVACFVVAFAVAGARWLLVGDSLALLLTGVFAAGALAVKNESDLELPLMALAVGALALVRRSRRRFLLYAAACGAAALTALPWAAWRRAHGVPATLNPLKALDPAFLAGRADRVRPTATTIYHHLTNLDEWLLVVPAALVLCVVAAALTRRLVFLLPVLLIAANVAGLVWVYWTDPNDLSYLLGTSAYRTLDTIPMLACIVLAVTADALLRLRSGRPRGPN